MASDTFPSGVTLTAWEVSVMIFLVARLDPGDYDHHAVRSVIEKCRAVAADPPRRMRVVEG